MRSFSKKLDFARNFPGSKVADPTQAKHQKIDPNQDKKI